MPTPSLLPSLPPAVKSPNILVDRHWSGRVADFNLSKILKQDTAMGQSAGGPTNPLWQAPELLGGEPATPASDVYAFGIVSETTGLGGTPGA